MNWWEEIGKVVLAFVGSYALYHATLRRPKLTYFVSGFASCAIPGPPEQVVWIYQITIQNTGKAPAKDVRIAHYWLPQFWQVIQTVHHDVEQIKGENRIIRFSTIEPGMLITIAYMDTNHQRIMGAHDHVRSEDGLVKPTPVQLQRVTSKVMSWLILAFAYLGIYLVATWFTNGIRKVMAFLGP